MRWKWGLLACVGGAYLAVAAASAATPPALFKLSLAGTSSARWDYAAAPVAEDSCIRTERSEGIRSAKFRTRQPIVVRVVAGRVLPVDLRGIAGTVSLAGANTTKQECGQEGSELIADCAPTKRSFADAAARISSPRAGRLVLDSVRNVRLRRADCPRELGAVRGAPLGPVPGPLRASSLTNEDLTRLFLRGSKTRTTRFPTPQEGSLVERAEWTLTFVRVRT